MTEVVREKRVELSWIAPLDPKSSAYANFATLAHCILQGEDFNTAFLRRQGAKSLFALEILCFQLVQSIFGAA